MTVDSLLIIKMFITMFVKLALIRVNN